MHIVIINGPNLNLLGTRAPDVYGSTSLSELEDMCRAWAADEGGTASFYQSNHEGALIDRLHASRDADGIVINPGALTHYSYAIRDAIEAIEPPVVEVHISNVRDREPWRRTSVVSDVCVGTIFGRGIDGYRDAIRRLAAGMAWPVETLSYGPAHDDVADLRIPSGPGPFPVAVLIHGGFWRNTVGRDVLDMAAVDLTRRGWATWNIEFPRTGDGGDWRATPSAVARAIDFLTTIASERSLDLSHIVAIGHGSGGQLAIRSVSNCDTPIAAVVGLAPIGDLEAAHNAGVGGDSIEVFLGGTPAQTPDRYAAASPMSNLPIGVPLLVIHGDQDERIPAPISRSFAGRAADRGDTVVYHEIEGVGHRTLIEPASPAWDMIADEIDRLRS
jgi:3-dehydroquinate dehydratase type II